MFNAFKRFNEKYNQAVQPSTNSLGVDVIEKLSELAKMYKDGILTEEEFNKLKQQLIH